MDFGVSRFKKVAVGLGVTTLLAASVVGAVADNTVEQSITPGNFNASIANVELDSVAYSHSANQSDGSMVLTIDDSRGSGAGWAVTVESSNFVYSGDNGGTDIPAANFALTNAGAPVQTAGQAVDTGGDDADPTGPQIGNMEDGVSGTLDDPIVVSVAGPGFGQGTYTQALEVELDIPAMSRAGVYTGTLTVTEASAP